MWSGEAHLNRFQKGTLLATKLETVIFGFKKKKTTWLLSVLVLRTSLSLNLKAVIHLLWHRQFQDCLILRSMVVVHAFNPSILEAEADGPL